MLDTAIALMERGYLPDWLTRIGIRRLLVKRLPAGNGHDPQARDANLAPLILELRDSPIAPHAAVAQQRHCEPPAGFFQQVLGPRLKYSACWWPEEVKDLETAEAAMLALSCERAELGFDQDILELGCGWGSLTLWMAEFYPNSRIVAVSNFRSQRAFIETRCRERGFDNVQVVTVDMNDFHTDRRFDRVVAVDLFEPTCNDQALMARIHGWLKPGGKLFAHVSSHWHLSEPCENEDIGQWIGHFFSNGSTPSRDLSPSLRDDLKLEAQWHFDGCHYQRTLEAWLANQDRRRTEIMKLFRESHGPEQAERYFQRWRVFFMVRAELFGDRHGEQWGVSHYRFGKRA